MVTKFFNREKQFVKFTVTVTDGATPPTSVSWEMSDNQGNSYSSNSLGNHSWTVDISKIDLLICRGQMTSSFDNPTGVNVSYKVEFLGGNYLYFKTNNGLFADFSFTVGAKFILDDGTPTYLETLDKIDQWSEAQYIPSRDNKAFRKRA